MPYPFIGDEFWHLLAAKSFLSERWFSSPAVDNYWGPVSLPYDLEYRPPLYNFALGQIFSLFGPSYANAQHFNIAIGLFAALLMYLIAERHFGKPAALPSAALGLLAPIMLLLSASAEVRIFSAFLFLAGFYLIERKESWNLSALCLGLLFLTAGPLALSLLLTYLLYFAFSAHPLPGKKQAAAMLAIVLVIIAPHLARNFLLFGNPIYSSSSSFLLIADVPQYFALSPPASIDLPQAAKNTAENIIRTLLPLPLSRSGGGISFDLNPSTNQNLSYNPLSAVIGLPLLLLGLYAIARGWKKQPLLLFALIAGAAPPLLFGHFPASYTYSFLLPHALLLGIAGISAAAEHRQKAAIVLLCALFLLPSLFAFSSRMFHSPPAAAFWIISETSSRDVLISRDCPELSHATGRYCLTTPTLPLSNLSSFASKYKASYLVFGATDYIQFQREDVEKEFPKAVEVNGYGIYEISGG